VFQYIHQSFLFSPRQEIYKNSTFLIPEDHNHDFSSWQCALEFFVSLWCHVSLFHRFLLGFGFKKMWNQVSSPVTIYMRKPSPPVSYWCIRYLQLLSRSFCVHMSAFMTPNSHRPGNSETVPYLLCTALPMDRVEHNSSVVMRQLSHISLPVWQGDHSKVWHKMLLLMFWHKVLLLLFQLL
jgi:hypothetical protein